MLADNITHFARVLRHAGMPVGPDRVLRAIEAVELVGLDRRDDVHAALSAVMLSRHEQQALFDAAFATFWRDPKLLERLMYLMLPKIQGRGDKPRTPRSNRLDEALSAKRTREPEPPPPPGPDDEQRFEAALSFSDRERLQHADFETMTTAEYALARRLAEQVALPLTPLTRRRHEAAARGRIDLRATLRGMTRTPHTLAAHYTRARRELPPLVVLLDISGSMERYSRLFLHFVHGLTRRHPRVHTLTFGTRLTNISHCLRHRDPDLALQGADALVQDWKGGTRIASALAEFNQRWARRLLGDGASVLLVTDGLDRDTDASGGDLAAAAAALSRHAREVIWLNPLLRYEGFEPRAAGVRALLPHVSRHLPVHNLASLADLGRALRAARHAAPLPSH
jgi:hypothetical protein